MITAARKRRLGILALTAVIGTTGGAPSRAVTAGDLGSSLESAARLGGKIGDLAAGLSAATSQVASFGILDATVMSGMAPETRRSILAALDAWSGTGAVDAPRSVPVVSRCSVKDVAKSVRRCSRA
jgi:hypothetical protein